MDAKARDKQDVSHVSPPRHVTETAATCGEQSGGVETGVEAVHAPDVTPPEGEIGLSDWFLEMSRLPGYPRPACPRAGETSQGGETGADVAAVQDDCADGRHVLRDGWHDGVRRCLCGKVDSAPRTASQGGETGA
jgi:hypothetical protein